MKRLTLRRRVIFLLVLLILVSAIGCHQETSSTAVDSCPIPSRSTRPEVLIGAPNICQHPAFPTGCEATAAVMALQYWSEPISVGEFIDHHLVCNTDFYRKGIILHGPDPYEVFVGNPRTTNSYGCMSPVIRQALISYFGSDERIADTSGTSLSTLCESYIRRGIPAIVWATGDMSPKKRGNRWRLSSGETFTWPSGEHCLLLVGYNRECYFFNDPKYGETKIYLKELAQARYDELGQQSLVILPQKKR